MRSLLVLLVVGSLLAPAYADRDTMMSRMMMGGMMGPMMMGGMMGGMMGHGELDTYISYKEDLDLTDKQVKELKVIRSAYRKEVSGINTKVVDLQSELDELYETDGMDYKAVGRKVSEIEALQSKLRAAYFDALDRAEKVLTKEQRKKVRKLGGGMMHDDERPLKMDRMRM